MHYGSNDWRKTRRTTRNSKWTCKKKLEVPEESYYDKDFDWDLIVSSFAQQYGIRLHKEYEKISCQEFRQLLVGLNGDTPLGYVVQVRSETDQKKIKEMTKKEKQIRSEWANFKSKNQKQIQNQKKIELSGDEIDKVLSKLFG